jgi:hypothetical protein
MKTLSRRHMLATMPAAAASLQRCGKSGLRNCFKKLL